ncbi:MAG: hypothetical protein HDS56_06215 [Barnesiella sp.]|nr:hypothetical protein [Barnesiella sp.]
MNLANFKYSFVALAAVAGVFTSCSDSDDNDFDDNGSKVVLGNNRVFILNEGTMGMNNANITYYNPDKSGDIIADIFKLQNGVQLGDNGNDLIEYNDDMYVAVYGSNYLARLNSAGVEMVRKEFASDADFRGGIRSIDADNGFIYASFYGGVVAKFDARTLEVKAKLTTTGSNLEDIVVEDGKIYVANSYAIIDGVYTYLDELIVVDARTFTQLPSIKVTSNPNRVLEADDKIFVISNDYSQESYVLQMVEPRNDNKVTVIGYATDMAEDDDVLYLVDSRTDYTTTPFTTTNTFYSYDIKRGSLSNTSFLRNAPAELASASVYSMAVDDETGDIYINTTYYTYSNGDVYRFRRNGTFVEKFDCGGQNPRAIVFMDR